jgi:hypothetical protein
MTDAWTLEFDGWDPADEGSREALPAAPLS